MARHTTIPKQYQLTIARVLSGITASMREAAAARDIEAHYPIALDLGLNGPLQQHIDQRNFQRGPC